MKINVSQIKQDQLADFVASAISGGNFSGMITQWGDVSGYLGDHVVYSSGEDQLIFGVKLFNESPLVPFSGAATGSVASRALVEQKIAYFIGSLSGTMTGGYVPINGNATIGGYKEFTGAVAVGTPTGATHATNIRFVSGVSGALQAQINSVSVPNAVTTNTAQTISGQKTFTTSPRVPTPTNTGDAANKAYVDTRSPSGVVYTSGDQMVSGVKTFTQSPLVPIATLPQQAVSKQQLDALGVSIGVGTGGTVYAGVMSLNGQTGAASGAVYLQGAGTVTVTQCGAVFYVSGFTPNNSNLYSVQIPLASGATGGSFAFPTGSGQAFFATPTVNATLSVTSGPIGFIGHVLHNVGTGGFGIAFESGIPGNGYTLNITAIPVASGTSGFLALVGQDGRAGATLVSRGVWREGVIYSNLDWIYQQTNAASYVCTNTHVSTPFNAPGGTGGAYWSILSSGMPGPTGFWVYRGQYRDDVQYRSTHSVTLSGSTYGFTGSTSSGTNPVFQSGGWTVLAKAGDLGYFVNSGIITGNFVNMSFFLEPVVTGYDLSEAFVSKSFRYTGYALGCVTSGVKPDLGNFILTGRIYVRDFATNTKTILHDFVLNTGVYNKFSGDFSYPITGMDRVGFELTSTLSGITKLSVGLFGFGVD